jgi:hypothetical protein
LLSLHRPAILGRRVQGAVMKDTTDCKKEAEEQYKAEREDMNAEVKSGFYFHLLLYLLLGVVAGVIYVINWMVVGGTFLPSNHDVVWVIAIAVGGIPFTYLMERHDRIREVHEQRLIRLEMKIDALLDRHKP